MERRRKADTLRNVIAGLLLIAITLAGVIANPNVFSFLMFVCLVQFQARL